MSDAIHYTYDVFISYSSKDAAWVRGELLPRLEQAGLKVIIDFRDFEVGTPSLINMERAVDTSRHTLVVLTPNWIASEWTEFESLLVGTRDPAGRRRKLIPLLLEQCDLPSRIAMLTYLDMRDSRSIDAHMARLTRSLMSSASPNTSKSEKMVKEQPSSPKESNPALQNPQPTTANVRQHLAQMHEDEFNAFCQDHFEEVSQSLSAGMTQTARINYLLDFCRRKPNQWAKLIGLLFE